MQLLVGLLITVLDQWSKALTPEALRNEGIAFGIFQHQQRVVLVAIGIGVILVGWLALRPNQRPLDHWGWTLVLAGVVSNLFDRVQFGAVRDVFIFPWLPAFNVADAAIVTGLGLVLLAIAQTRRFVRVHKTTLK